MYDHVCNHIKMCKNVCKFKVFGFLKECETTLRPFSLISQPLLAFASIWAKATPPNVAGGAPCIPGDPRRSPKISSFVPTLKTVVFLPPDLY